MRAQLLRLRWPAAYVAAVIAFLGLLSRYYHPVYGFTSLFQLDALEEQVMLPALRDRPVYVYRDTGSYDGQYYAQLACDPLLRDLQLPRAMDDLGYRSRRILGSWIAWLVGFGHPHRALDAYALLNPFCWLALAGLLLRIFPPRSGHDFVAWAGVLFSAGALASVRLALTDLPALLLVAATVLTVERNRPYAASGFLAAALLARETSLTAALVLKGRSVAPTLARAALALAPLLLWWLYVRTVAGSSSTGSNNFSWPVLAFLAKWRDSLAWFGDTTHPLVPWLNLAVLVGITVQAGWVLLRRELNRLWWQVALGQVALLSVLGPGPWNGFPGAAARVLLPLHLAFNALVPRTRAGFLVLLLGNVGLVCGFDQMLNTPPLSELASARVAGARVIVAPGEGWHGIERRGSRTWCWTAGTATLHLRTWSSQPETAAVLRLKLSPFTPSVVSVRQGDRLLSSHSLERRASLVEIPLVLREPDIELVFSTDRPGKLENDTPNARVLSYSVSEVSLSPANRSFTETPSIPSTNTPPSTR